MRKRPKKLTRRHKKFLQEQGYNPDDFMIISEDYESYTFYNKVTGMIWDPMRR